MMRTVLCILFFLAQSPLVVANDNALEELRSFLADFEIVAICRVEKQEKGEKYTPEKILTGDWKNADASIKKSTTGGFKGRVLIVCNPKRGANPPVVNSIMAITSSKVWWVPTNKRGGNVALGVSLKKVVELFDRDEDEVNHEKGVSTRKGSRKGSGKKSCNPDILARS